MTPEPPLALNVTVYEVAAAAVLVMLGADKATKEIMAAVRNPIVFALIIQY
jgi:hypothetical protein